MSPADRAATGLIVSALLVALVGIVPAAAQQGGDAEAAPDPVGNIRGARYKIADAKIANRLTRFDDAAGDQRTNEGEPAPDAPGHSDLRRVFVATGTMPRKLLNKMAREYPPGTVGAWYGTAASWDIRDPLIVVAAEIARRRPPSAAGQQIQIGIDGSDAAAMEVAAGSDDIAGLSRFSLSGVFNNGAWASGTTDVSGYVPGEDFEWYTADDGVWGYYDQRKKTWYTVLPRPEDAQRITVAIRTSTNQGEVVDRLELPGGGVFIDLDQPTGGLDLKGDLPPLGCRALETFSDASTDPVPTDPDATLIRYTAGAGPDVRPNVARRLMAPAEEALGPLPMVLSAVGSDDPPIEVQGLLEAVPGTEAVRLTMEVPEGQWTFAPAEGAQVALPNGEALIDHRSLTGQSGVVTGFGLDGVVIGDPTCGAVASAEAEETTDLPVDEAGEGEATGDGEATDPETGEPVEE
jgi:hypothetical protein